MNAFTYIKQGEFGFTEKEKPTMIDAHDAIVYDKPQILPLPDMYGKTSSSRREVWMDATVRKSWI